jgi:predicted ATPase with chaperone activity
LRKEGSACDPLTIGILAAHQQITAADPEKYVIMGEFLTEVYSPFVVLCLTLIKAK